MPPQDANPTPSFGGFGLKKTEELKTYFEISYSYVASLKPKPTKKKPAKS